MGFRRNSQYRLFLDEPVKPRRPAPYPVAASQAPSLDYATPMPALGETPAARVPMVITPTAYPSLSPWRRDVRFALGLVTLVLGLNLGLYYAFHHPVDGGMDRLEMSFSPNSRTDLALTLEERVLTYSSYEAAPADATNAPEPRRPFFPSLAK